MTAPAKTTRPLIAHLNELMAQTSEHRCWKLADLLRYKLGYDEYWNIQQYDDGWGATIEWDKDGGMLDMASATHTSMIGAIRRCLLERLKHHEPEPWAEEHLILGDLR